MEERLAYSGKEQDMVFLHHEVEVEFPNGQPTENHRATLLEFGRTQGERSYTAMALTVGIPAAIGALLLLGKNIKAKGVVRPIDPEIYVPGCGDGDELASSLSMHLSPCVHLLQRGYSRGLWFQAGGEDGLTQKSSTYVPTLSSNITSE
ncbi:UNVERIFIED_CONTAM: Alpha-aminoadipic semialdehyde synthase [Sesamum angustifolium]|uniref:Alpha-aminoadipic semialdehyde synthase n=1 Tax=Sesamum angustifolium TaxID=2727405 RepID=A0AAW2N5V5_9LAMI